MNTAEIITGEVCGTVAFLGCLWLALHYAKAGVLKLAAPPPSMRQQPAVPENTAPAAAGEAPAAAVDPAKQIRPAA